MSTRNNNQVVNFSLVQSGEVDLPVEYGGDMLVVVVQLKSYFENK